MFWEEWSFEPTEALSKLSEVFKQWGFVYFAISKWFQKPTSDNITWIVQLKIVSIESSNNNWSFTTQSSHEEKEVVTLQVTGMKWKRWKLCEDWEIWTVVKRTAVDVYERSDHLGFDDTVYDNFPVSSLIEAKKIEVSKVLGES